jgi:hypothetical protein
MQVGCKGGGGEVEGKCWMDCVVCVYIICSWGGGGGGVARGCWGMQWQAAFVDRLGHAVAISPWINADAACVLQGWLSASGPYLLPLKAQPFSTPVALPYTQVPFPLTANCCIKAQPPAAAAARPQQHQQHEGR